MRRFGNWETVETLAEGGQAWVYSVRPVNNSQGAVSVLKRLKRKTSEVRLARFKREIEVGAKLKHPNVICVKDFDISPANPYFVMEYYPLGTLAQLEIASMTVRQRLLIVRQICEGVGHAHSHGVFHRDLKPENVLMKDAGTPVVSDFGLCIVSDDDRRLTETMEAVGPRLYIAPELEDGRYEVADARSDVYSLGKLLYWMFAGRVFSREKHRIPEYDLTHHLSDKAMHFVNEVLDRSIAADPEKRLISDGNQFAEAVSLIIKRIEMGANAIGPGIPQSCIYCGVGTYKQGFSNFIDNTPIDDGHSFGITLVNPHNRKWLLLVCDNCGNLQWFRPDLAKDKTVWDSKKKE